MDAVGTLLDREAVYLQNLDMASTGTCEEVARSVGSQEPIWIKCLHY